MIDARYIPQRPARQFDDHRKKTTLLRLVGTDGHRLAVAGAEVGSPNTKPLARNIKTIIPEAAQEMRRLLEEAATKNR